MEFDGVSLDEHNLLPTLREAAHGSVPSSDFEWQQNPSGWALAMAQAVARGPLGPALARALAALLDSDDEAERGLSVDVQRIVPLVDGATLWPLFFDQVARGRVDAADDAAAALVVLLGRGALAWDRRAEAVLLQSGLPPRLAGKLLKLAGALDRASLVQHPELFFAPSEDELLLRISQAATTLDGPVLERFARDLGAALAGRGRPLSPSALQTLGEMIESRKKAG